MSSETKSAEFEMEFALRVIAKTKDMTIERAKAIAEQTLEELGKPLTKAVC